MSRKVKWGILGCASIAKVRTILRSGQQRRKKGGVIQGAVLCKEGVRYV